MNLSELDGKWEEFEEGNNSKLVTRNPQLMVYLISFLRLTKDQVPLWWKIRVQRQAVAKLVVYASIIGLG